MGFAACRLTKTEVRLGSFQQKGYEHWVETLLLSLPMFGNLAILTNLSSSYLSSSSARIDPHE